MKKFCNGCAIVSAALLLAAALLAANAQADVLLELDLAQSAPFEDRLDAPGEAWSLRVGKPWFYAWGSYEEPGVSLVGQSLGTVELLGVGVGTRGEWKGWTFAIELGRFYLDESLNAHIRDEAVRTKLLSDHAISAAAHAQNCKTFPVCKTVFVNPEHTAYSLDDAAGGRVRLTRDLWRFWRDHLLGLSASVRLLQVDENLDMCTGPDPSCDYPVDGRHWQNRSSLQMSDASIGIFVRW